MAAHAAPHASNGSTWHERTEPDDTLRRFRLGITIRTHVRMECGLQVVKATPIPPFNRYCYVLPMQPQQCAHPVELFPSLTTKPWRLQREHMPRVRAFLKEGNTVKRPKGVR